MPANTEHGAKTYSRGLTHICLHANNLLGAQMPSDAEILETLYTGPEQKKWKRDPDIQIW